LPGWLRAHHITYGGLLSADLKTLIMELMGQDWGPPPIIGPRGGALTNVERTVIYLVAMLGRAMVKAVVPSSHLNLDSHIKVFMSMLHKLDKCMLLRMADESTSKPCWAEKYNFLCLLNLPGVMR